MWKEIKVTISTLQQCPVQKRGCWTVSVWVTGAGDLRRGPSGAAAGERDKGQAAVEQSAECGRPRPGRPGRPGRKGDGAGGEGMCARLQLEEAGAELKSGTVLDSWPSGSVSSGTLPQGFFQFLCLKVVPHGGYETRILEPECLG